MRNTRKPPRHSVDISEEAGVRYLHFGSDYIQGAMRIARPYALELEYTRGGRSLLLYRPGSGATELRPLPPPDYTTQPTAHALVTRGARELLTFRKAGIDLELHRLPLDGSGAARLVRLPARASDGWGG